MKAGSMQDGERIIKSMPIHNVVAWNTLIAGKVIGSTYQAILPACATTMSSEPVASAETTPPTSPETRDNGLTEAMQKEEAKADGGGGEPRQSHWGVSNGLFRLGGPLLWAAYIHAGL